MVPAMSCNAAARALSQQVGLPVQQLENAGPNGAETGDGDLERRFHDGTPDAMCEMQEPPRMGGERPGSL